MGMRKKINALKKIAREKSLKLQAKKAIKRAKKAPTAGQKLHALMHGKTSK